jgi:outer membrane protein TolC
VSQVDVNNGYYVNPLDYTKNSGLLSVGVSVPLLKGLIVDERRMAKQRAEKIQEAYQFEKTIAINELLYQSTLLYINWWYTSQRFDITKNIAETTLQRHMNMRQRFLNGDRAAIDTVETFTQVQNRRIQVSESELDLIKSRIALVAFLSDSTASNLMLLTAQAFPEIDFAARNSFNIPLLTVMQQIELHPELQLYNNKVDVLKIEKKWKEEKLKPKLNVEYYALQQPLSPNTWNPYLSNYKWGVEFSSPLFLREARGDLKLQQLKIQETDLNREWKSNQILQKSQSLEAAAVQLKTQMQNANKNVSLYKQLLDAENKKLELGESSLFLVNTRENSYFESLMKELELKTKNSVAHTDWNALWFLPYE